MSTNQMTATPAAPTIIEGMKPIAKGVFIEAIRRKEFYSFFILAIGFALFAMIFRFVGIENPATGTFILNLGITYAAIAAHLLVLILAVKQIPSEIENRTIYPILAKPVDRFTYILGKWSAISLVGILVFTSLLIITYLPTPKLEPYNFATLLQMFGFQLLSITILSAMGILFSTFSPPPVSLIALGLIYLTADSLMGLLKVRASGEATENLLNIVSAYVPNFSKLSLISRYTDGIAPVGAGELIGLLLYGAILLSLSLFGSSWLFHRKTL